MKKFLFFAALLASYRAQSMMQPLDSVDDCESHVHVTMKSENLFNHAQQLVNIRFDEHIFDVPARIFYSTIDALGIASTCIFGALCKQCSDDPSCSSTGTGFFATMSAISGLTSLGLSYVIAKKTIVSRAAQDLKKNVNDHLATQENRLVNNFQNQQFKIAFYREIEKKLTIYTKSKTASQLAAQLQTQFKKDFNIPEKELAQEIAVKRLDGFIPLEEA